MTEYTLGGKHGDLARVKSPMSEEQRFGLAVYFRTTTFNAMRGYYDMELYAVRLEEAKLLWSKLWRFTRREGNRLARAAMTSALHRDRDRPRVLPQLVVVSAAPNGPNALVLNRPSRTPVPST
jgi:hypothetical protein